MPIKGRYYPTKKMPTPEDRNFIRGIVNGQKKPTAFKESYPNHPTVKRYMDIVNKRVEPEDEGERSRLNASIAQMAKDIACLLSPCRFHNPNIVHGANRNNQGIQPLR